MERGNRLYSELKQCKTMKEITQRIPDYIYDRLTFIMIGYWCCVPIFAMIYSYVTRTDADLLIYLSVLVSGIVGIYLIVLRFIKLNIIQKVKTKGYIKEIIPQFSLFIMLIWILFSCFHAKNKYYAFIGEGYSHEGFLTFIAYAGFFGSSLFITKKDVYKKFLIIFCLVATSLSFLTILQYLGFEIRAFSGYMKLAGTFHNTNHFGYYLTLSAICSSGLFLISSKKYQQLIYLSQFFIIFSALIFNNTFGAYLGVLGGLVITIIIFSLCLGQFKVKFIIPFIVAILLSVVLNLTTSIVESNLNVLQKDTAEIIKNTEKSGKAGSGRWELWVGAVQFIREEPLLGYGPENLAHNYAQIGINMLKPHNEYLQFAASSGLPSLLFYLIAMVSLYLKGIKNRKKLDLLVVLSFCVLSGYLISAFVGNTKFYVTPYFMIFLALATKTKLKE